MYRADYFERKKLCDIDIKLSKTKNNTIYLHKVAYVLFSNLPVMYFLNNILFVSTG